MRRKSTRNAQKATPEKTVKEAETPPKTRRSRRRRRSPSKSSDSEEEVVTVTKRTPPEETPDTTTKSHTPTDEETLEEPVWKVAPTEVTPKGGEIQRLKICLKRPSPDSPEKSRSRHKSNSQTEDDATSSEDKSTRRTRSRGSPVLRNDGLSSQEGDEDVDEKKGKGKSKGKHKSKIEKSPHLSEPEIQTNNEISENVQVTPQSPSIDKPVDNENDYNKVDADDIQNVNESVQRHENISKESANNICRDSDKEQENMDNNKTQSKESDDDEPLSVILKPATVDKIKVAEKSESNIDENQQVISEETLVQNQEVISEDSEAKTERVTSEDSGEIISESQEETSEQSAPQLQDSVPVESDKTEDLPVATEKEQLAPEQTSEQSSSQEAESKDTEEKSPEKLKKTPEKLETTNEMKEIEPQQEETKMEVEKTTEVQHSEKVEQPENLPESAPPTAPTEVKMVEESKEVTLPPTKPVEERRQKYAGRRTPRLRLKRENDYVKAAVQEKEDGAAESCHIKPSKKKRKWEGSTDLTSPLVKIDLESIQGVWPSIDFPEEPDLNVEVERERRRSTAESSAKKIERKVSVEYKSDLSERPSFEKQSSVSSTNQEIEDNSNIIAFNRKISIVDDTASKLRPPPSPAKNAISNILFITNLVRPFTVKQLKELLERTGKIQEDRFWTDRIKSKCYVQYETQEEAEATRNALHGVQWPIGNGKKLMIDYATEEDMNNAKNPPVPPPAAPVTEVKTAVKENLEPVENKARPEEKITKEVEKKRPEGPVREWDIGKKDVRRDRSRSRERSRKHRRSLSPPDDFISRKQRKAEESVPQKLMDDLFLKTKTTPSIYWQPLSPEEIAMKQQQRLIRMEEHKRRMEENSRMKARDIGRGAFRRRYD